MGTGSLAKRLECAELAPAFTPNDHTNMVCASSTNGKKRPSPEILPYLDNYPSLINLMVSDIDVNFMSLRGSKC